MGVSIPDVFGQFTMKVDVTGLNLPEGATVWMGGSVTPGWHPENNPEARVEFGRVENGQIVGSFSRSIGPGRRTVYFDVEDGDHIIHIVRGIKVNDVMLTEFATSVWEYAAAFDVQIVDQGAVEIKATGLEGTVTELITLPVRVTGVSFPPGSENEDLNKPVSQDMPVRYLASYGGMRNSQRMMWMNSAWEATITAVQNGRYYLRPADEQGEFLAGVFCGGTELKNLKNLGNGYRVYEFDVVNGQVRNPRPDDERPGIIVITVGKSLGETIVDGIKQFYHTMTNAPRT